MAISLVRDTEKLPHEGAESRGEDSAVPGLLGFLTTLHEPVFEFDGAGRCHYTNPAFRALLGMPIDSPAAAPVGRSEPMYPEWLRHDELTRWCFFVEVHQSGRAAELGIGAQAFSLQRMDGTEVPCHLAGERLLSRTGALLGLVAVVTPVGAVAPTNADLSQMSKELNRLSDAVTKLLGTHGGAGGPRPFPFTERRVSVANGRPLEHAAEVPDASISVASIMDPLSERERDIVRGLLEGKRTATMARELFLSEHTVRNHLKHIYRKVGVHSLGELREVVMPFADGLTKRDAKRR